MHVKTLVYSVALLALDATRDTFVWPGKPPKVSIPEKICPPEDWYFSDVFSKRSAKQDQDRRRELLLRAPSIELAEICAQRFCKSLALMLH